MVWDKEQKHLQLELGRILGLSYKQETFRDPSNNCKAILIFANVSPVMRKGV